MYRYCRNDAITLCKAKQEWHDWSTVVDNSPLVLPCLYHHMHIDDNDSKDDNNEQSPALSKQCAQEIKRIMRVRAKSIDLIPEVQEACSDDLGEFCSQENDMGEKGEELRCLQRNFKTLRDECKEAITKYTKYENKDISLDQILMKACMPIIERACSDKKEEKGELLDCLIKQKNTPGIDPKCKAGIEHHQLVNLENIEFNYKFKKVCKPEIAEHCSTLKTKPEIIACLSDISLQDTLLDNTHRISEKCRDQLRFELFQQNENIYLDPELAKACKTDIENVCKDVKSGQGQLLECLKSNQKEISEECKAKLFKRDKINLIDQNVDYALQTRCKNAIGQFCHVDSEQDIISCLRKHLLKPNLEGPCRMIVINRIMMQNKDARLNPTLWKACKRDVNYYCKNEFSDQFDINQDLKGRVLKCLRGFFVKNALSKRCEVEVEQIMREAANVDVRLDPLVVENCVLEMEKLCSNESNDKKENCLRLSFQKRLISKESKCFEVIIIKINILYYKNYIIFF